MNCQTLDCIITCTRTCDICCVTCNSEFLDCWKNCMFRHSAHNGGRMVIRIFLWIYVCNCSFGSLFRKTPSWYCENLNDSLHLKEKKRVLITLMHCLRYMIYAGRNIWMCCLYSKNTRTLVYCNSIKYTQCVVRINTRIRFSFKLFRSTMTHVLCHSHYFSHPSSST